jgi:hypothetical protein
MNDPKTKTASIAVLPGSFDYLPFTVDLNAICNRPVFGPLWWEYAIKLKGPVFLSAPQKMLPDGHPRKPKKIGRRWRSRMLTKPISSPSPPSP